MLALIPAVGGIVGVIPREAGLAFGAILLCAAGVRAGLERLSLHQERARADRLILAGRRTDELGWRLAELTSAHERRQLARSLHGLVRLLDPRYLPGASPVNRPAARPLAPRIEALAARIGDLERPVDARGVLLVDRLLTDGAGPLYARARADELPGRIEDALDALERR
jgi:hypothetical protein